MNEFVDKLSSETASYFKKWDSFRTQVGIVVQRPSTIGWKVEDLDEFNSILGKLLNDKLTRQCHVGYVDGRYIASIIFLNPIYKDIQILKLMQRRASSSDATGLDHVDFYVKDLSAIEREFTQKKIVDWSHESNASHHWISLRFDNTEAKFVDHLVIDVCIMELQQASLDLGFKPKQLAS